MSVVGARVRGRLGRRTRHRVDSQSDTVFYSHSNKSNLLEASLCCAVVGKAHCDAVLFFTSGCFTVRPPHLRVFMWNWACSLKWLSCASLDTVQPAAYTQFPHGFRRDHDEVFLSAEYVERRQHCFCSEVVTVWRRSGKMSRVSWTAPASWGQSRDHNTCQNPGSFWRRGRIPEVSFCLKRIQASMSSVFSGLHGHYSTSSMGIDIFIQVCPRLDCAIYLSSTQSSYTEASRSSSSTSSVFRVEKS
ncbi:hypothetical protein EXIGLDRAFT_51166 [Exidia glandulosa HHB12029]|uniref:Uncharacterized protein n=1 Tax=Exidia glandulosa HHB12029 TaxID=1314781 RepID=A0A165IED2_EXIGL|nr:hypothetical protein EXIGLDRAFT_51166 [Exidia glandulosa HHB12029]